MENPVYLGDAVYAQYDGNGVELRLNRHDAPVAVYLEPEVLSALIAFWKEKAS
jgi:hypothetical protein